MSIKTRLVLFIAVSIVLEHIGTQNLKNKSVLMSCCKRVKQTALSSLISIVVLDRKEESSEYIDSMRIWVDIVELIHNSDSIEVV